MHEGDSSDEEAEALALARLAFGTKYEKTTADKNQPVKKLVWTLVDHKELPKACARSKVEGWQGEEYNARLMNETTPVNDIYTAWKHLIPPMWLPKLVETANNSLSDDNIDKNYRLTCKAEMECILGEQLGAAVEGLGDFSSCFAVTNSPDTLFPPPGFGQYGVTKNRALIVSRAAHLSHGPLQPDGADPHWFMDGPIKEFNEHYAKNFRASWLGTMDETGPAWHGQEGEGDYNKCPHITLIPRKPEPICALFNDIACAMSRVLNKLEFEKALKYHAELEHVHDLGSYNAAMTLRLSSPWANRNGAVYGDSRFGQIKSAFGNWKNGKTHSMFDIKTGTGLFPRKEIIKLCPQAHGSLVVMTAKIEDLTLYAIGQRRGPAVHTFLTTFGTFETEVPSRFKNLEHPSRAPWTTVSILNKVTTAQPAIDCINRQLFDQLGMQYTFTTRCFETRFSQHFMLPLTYVNAINWAKYAFPEQFSDIGTKAMLMKLATGMVHNSAWMELRKSTGDGSGGGATKSGRRYNPSEKVWHQVRIDGGPPSRESPCKHILILLSQLEGYSGAKQQRCWECNELCSWCCARCSSRASWVPLHPPVAQGSNKRHACLAAHRANPAGGYKVSQQIHTGVSATAKRRRRIPMEVL